MTEWATSDQHFGHKNIIQYSERPFVDLEEMHTELVSRFNDTVKPGDHTWHLGDFSFGTKWVEQILPILNGSHSLVCGNHDGPYRKKDVARYRRAGFQEIHYGHLDTLGFRLSHFPHPQTPIEPSLILLHGHVHECWKVKNRMINVGVDQWDYRPVSFDTLRTLL